MARARRDPIPNGWSRGVEKLFERRLQHCRFTGTHQDYLDLFVRPEHHKAWMDVSSMAQAPRDRNTMFNVEGKTGGKITLIVELSGSSWKPLAPNNPHIVNTAPPELVQSVTSWVTERWELGLEFGRIKKVISMLNTQVTSPGHVRYLFPSIVPVLSAAGLDTDAFSTPRVNDCPPVSFELRQAIPIASATVAGAMLLDELPDPGDAPFELSFPEVGYSTRRQSDNDFGIIEVL
ncbi:MAG: hypothetical protein ACXVCO_01195 [Ktedonobacterales bacterium]